MQERRINFVDLMPMISLAALAVVFAVLTDGQMLSAYNITNIINQSIPTIMAGLGMMMVVSVGGTDISTGGVLALSGTVCAIVAQQLGFAFTIPTVLVIGIVIGGVMGLVVTKCHVPSFMVTISFLMALKAAVNYILYDQVVFCTPTLASVDNMNVKLPVLIALVLIVSYVFKYTKFGGYCKSMGENELAAKFAGVPTDRVKIIAFMISATLAAAAGLFTVARLGGASNTMGSNFEMKVMMSMFVAGIPVSGGYETKVYKLCFGAPTIIILENGLTLCGVSGALSQGIKGIVLIGVVCLTQFLQVYNTTARKQRVLPSRV